MLDMKRIRLFACSESLTKVEKKTDPILKLSNKKNRILADFSNRTLKWNSDVLHNDFAEQLKIQIEAAGFNQTLKTQLFHNDFNFHKKGLNTLIEAVEKYQDETISNLDLILRWLTLNFLNSKPAFILLSIDYMFALFQMLSNRNYQLIAYEAESFFPYLIIKFGDPIEKICKEFRKIIKQIIYEPAKVYTFLINGLKSKNLRQIVACLEELDQMIQLHGLIDLKSLSTLEKIAEKINHTNNKVRNAALNTITTAFQIVGIEIYDHIKKVSLECLI